MSFNTMIKGMIEQGLLDKDRKLTEKGHQYAEDIKKKYIAKTGGVKPKVKATETAIWPTAWK